ncbi:allantoinase, mitochondrial-like [Montipora capricornis]|uniref:allantoinase, mitochondrial-like n=1 Tax=Montipora capricornis TaxID=246305 RepID=UPI0035F1E578
MADGEDVLVIKGQRIVLPDSIISGCVVVKNGQIVGIEAGYSAISAPLGAKVLDAENLVVMPGVVDSHVHVNEPGRTEWEGFATATQAAAAGGITTIVDMPLNSIPPTTTMDGFNTKLNCARNKCWTDVAFWGGVIPGNQAEIKPMVSAGIKGFKCFLVHSGVDEFPCVTENDVRLAMMQMQGTDAVFLFHAEVELPQGPPITSQDPSKYSTFLESRPESMENQAIEMVIKLCREYRVPCHIVHLSSASALPMIRRARADGVPLTIETTHHYLSLTAEDVPEGATQYKCCPPVRDCKNRDSLWDALKSRDIDLVISDHSPCTVDLKCLEKGDFMAAWGGISGVQYGLSIFWSNACRRGFTLHDVVRVLCEEPAKLSRLSHRKGKIAVGMDADLVLWNPDESFVVDQKNTRHRNKVTPYHNMELKGVVHKTILRGNLVYERDRVCDHPAGQLLLETGQGSPTSKI